MHRKLCSCAGLHKLRIPVGARGRGGAGGERAMMPAIWTPGRPGRPPSGASRCSCWSARRVRADAVPGRARRPGRRPRARRRGSGRPRAAVRRHARLRPPAARRPHRPRAGSPVWQPRRLGQPPRDRGFPPPARGGGGHDGLRGGDLRGGSPRPRPGATRWPPGSPGRRFGTAGARDDRRRPGRAEPGLGVPRPRRPRTLRGELARRDAEAAPSVRTAELAGCCSRP